MKDLSNKKFGKLTVLKFLKTDSHYNSFWLCKCDCGNEIVARADHLQRGGTKSCGCLRNKNMSRTMYENGGKRLHRIWVNCIKRCENPNEPYYNRYGGRGICQIFLRNCSKAGRSRSNRLEEGYLNFIEQGHLSNG